MVILKYLLIINNSFTYMRIVILLRRGNLFIYYLLLAQGLMVKYLLILMQETFEDKAGNLLVEAVVRQYNY